jgi:hypothetical protein
VTAFSDSIVNSGISSSPDGQRCLRLLALSVGAIPVSHMGSAYWMLLAFASLPLPRYDSSATGEGDGDWDGDGDGDGEGKGEGYRKQLEAPLDVVNCSLDLRVGESDVSILGLLRISQDVGQHLAQHFAGGGWAGV